MSFTSSLLATYLLTGLTIGFSHCVGMCGPLVISFSLNLPDRHKALPHLLYHGGRVATYILLGAVMGASGSFTMVAAHIRSLQIGAMAFAGALVILMGLAMGGWLPWGRLFKSNASPTGFMTGLIAELLNRSSTMAALPLGMVLGLLPCGPVYTALLGTARAGMSATDPLQGIVVGMALMAAFGFGTVPALLIIGRLAGSGRLKWHAGIYKIGAALMIGLGVYFIVEAVRF